MTLNEIPAWSDIESQPWFAELTPEEKQQSLTKWQGDMMAFAKDPKEKFAVAATSKAKARSFFGEEMPDDPIADALQRRQKDLEDIGSRYDAFSKGELEEDDEEVLTLNDTLKGNTPYSVIKGRLFVSPQLVWDKAAYEKVVNEAPVDEDERVLAMSAYDGSKERAAEGVVNSLGYTDEAFRDFAAKGFKEGKSNAAILDEWKANNKLPDGILGSLRGVGRQAYFGLRSGLSGLERAMGGLGGFFGSESAQKYAEESGKEAQSYMQRTLGEGPEFIGELTSGAVSIIPTIAAGAAASVISEGAAIPAAASITAGAIQSAGATQAETYEFYRNQGLDHANALAESRVDGLVSGLITGAITHYAGKLGDKIGLGKGIEGLFSGPASKIASKLTQREISESLKAGAKAVGGSFIQEGSEELLDQAAQDAYSIIKRDPTLTLAEAINNALQAGKVGAVLGGAAEAGKIGLKSLLNSAKLSTGETPVEKELQRFFESKQIAADAVVGNPNVQNYIKALGTAQAVVDENAPINPRTGAVLEDEVKDSAKNLTNNIKEDVTKVFDTVIDNQPPVDSADPIRDSGAVIYDLRSAETGEAMDLDSIEMALDNAERKLQKGQSIDWAVDRTWLPNVSTASVPALKQLLGSQAGIEAMRERIAQLREEEAPAEATISPKPPVSPASETAPIGETQPPAAASMPMMVTREMNQQLADLGYSRKERNALRPEQAAAIIAAGVRKEKPVSSQPPQGKPVETPTNALPIRPTTPSLPREERPEMGLQQVGEGNAQPEKVAETGQAGEEVAPREGFYDLETRTNFAKLPASVRGDRFVLSPVMGLVFDRMYAQSVTPPAFTRPEQAVRSLNESRYNADVSLPVSLGRSADGADIFTSAADIPPVVIPQQTPSPPTTGAVPTKTLPAGQKVTPGGVASPGVSPETAPEPAPKAQPEQPDAKEKAPTEPSESTLSIAKRFGGRIAWSQGDLAIIEGFQLFGSKSLYVAVVGDRYSLTDFTLMKPEQRKALLGDNEELFLRKREEIVEANNRMLAQNPDGPFTNGQTVVVSKNVPQNVASVFREWVRLLGLSAPTRIVLTTPRDGIDMAAEYGGKFRRIGVTSLMSDNERGQMTPLGEDDFHIFYKEDTSYARTLEVLAHELGHILERQSFKNLPDDQRKAIIAEHEKWLKRVGSQKALDGIRELRAMRVGRIQPNVDRADDRFDSLNAYWKSFSEWFADQVARWATTTDKPLTVIEKFFARLGKKLREFFNLKGSQFAPNQRIADWLNSLSPDLNAVVEETLAPAEPAPEAQPEQPVSQPVQAFRDAVSQMTPTAQAKWTPELRATAEAYLDSGGTTGLQGLSDVQQKVVGRFLPEEVKAAFDAEDARKRAQRNKLPDHRESSLPPTPGKQIRKIGKGAMESVPVVLDEIAKVIPNIRDLVEVRESVEGEPDAEGFYDPQADKAVVLVDNVYLKPQHGGSQEAALRETIVHELLHRGFAKLRQTNPQLFEQFEAFSITDTNDNLLDSLVRRGYTMYSNWRNDPAQAQKAREEVFVRKAALDLAVNGLDAIKSPTSLASQFFSWLRGLLNKLLGRKVDDETLLHWSRVFLNAAQADFIEKTPGERMHAFTAYHGTPHKVDKFSLSKIGTGEGAQAYGWGLYFAESREVGEGYRKKLTGVDSFIDLKTGDLIGQWDSRFKEVSNLRESLLSAGDKAEFDRLYETKMDGGNLYTVELLPDADEFLDWDKPLSEQSEKVKVKVAPYLTAIKGSIDGDRIYSVFLASSNTAQEASQKLASLGIPGIRYADGQSRVSPLEIRARKAEVSARKADVERDPSATNQSALRYAEQALSDLVRKDQEGTRNYVIFDENLVKILEENGQVLTPPAESDIRYSLGEPPDMQAAKDRLNTFIDENKATNSFLEAFGPVRVERMQQQGEKLGPEYIQAQVRPIMQRAQAELGFELDEEGNYVLSQRATDKAQSVLVKWLQDGRKFAKAYNKKAEKFFDKLFPGMEDIPVDSDMAAAVLLHEIMSYAKALAASSPKAEDQILLDMIRPQYGSVVLANYDQTMHKSGRTLQTARNYSEGTELGQDAVENANKKGEEKVTEELGDEALPSATEEGKAGLEAGVDAAPDIPAPADPTLRLLDLAVESLDEVAKADAEAVFDVLRRLGRAQDKADAIRKAGNKAMSILTDKSWLEEPLPDTLEELDVLVGKLRVEAAEKLAKLRSSLEGAKPETKKKVKAEAAKTKSKTDSIQKLIDKLSKMPDESKEAKPKAETLRSAIADAIKEKEFDEQKVRDAATKFGATPEQTERLVEEAERLHETAQDKTPSKTKLRKFLLSHPQETLYNPEQRQALVKTFLRNEVGMNDAEIARYLPKFESSFGKAMEDARKKYLDGLEKRFNAPKKARESRVDAQNRKLLQALRAGLAETKSPKVALLERLGFKEFKPTDKHVIAKLDAARTEALANGEFAKARLKQTELSSLLLRRRPPMGWMQLLNQAWITSALSSFRNLALNVWTPLGEAVSRYFGALAGALKTGDFTTVTALTKALGEAFRRVPARFKFAYSANTFTQQANAAIAEQASLIDEFRRSLSQLRDKKLSKKDRTKAATRVVFSFGDYSRRLLQSIDESWFSVLESFISSANLTSDINKYGIKAEALTEASVHFATQAKNDAYAVSQIVDRLSDYLDGLRGKTTAEIQQALELYRMDQLGISPENLAFTNEMLDVIEQLRLRSGAEGDSLLKAAKRNINDYRRLAWVRAAEKADADTREWVSAVLTGKGVEKVDVDQVLKDATEGSERAASYGMGLHRVEEAPALDIGNTFAKMIEAMGQQAIRVNPMLGRMMVGFFGIPVNLMNKSLWFAPGYGALRYFAFRKMAERHPEKQFYAYSLANEKERAQRFREVIFGHAVFGLLAALGAFDDRDEEETEGLYVTLGGPANKTEKDAWLSRGFRPYSVCIKHADGSVTSIPYGVGAGEFMKMPLMAAGAFDDMRLNKKLGNREDMSSALEYFNAFAAGVGRQATFLGAKNTVGALLPDTFGAGTVANLAFAAGNFFPFNGLDRSLETLISGPPDRSRTGAILANIPYLRHFEALGARPATNVFGDPWGSKTADPIEIIEDRLLSQSISVWNTSKPLMGRDKKLYEFIGRYQVGPNGPQRGALELRNGYLTDQEWANYRDAWAANAKREWLSSLDRMARMDEDGRAKAAAELSTRASRKAKDRFNYK